MTNTVTEIDANDPVRALAQLASLLNGSLLFARALVAHSREAGALDDETLAALKAQSLFKFKDMQTQGLPLQHEAFALSESLRQLQQILDGIR